jgi:glycosyltransferase involved in cell wall biosynthesis
MTASPTALVAATPVVSVVMPTFNRLEYLRPAVESVLAQTFTRWELIIADDGSGADTRTYLQSLDDPRVRVIWLEHTGRPSAVTNVALRAARGYYVAFLDSDDLWLPKKLETQIAALQLDRQRGWSYTSFAIVDESGQRVTSARTRAWPTPSGWILEKLLAEDTVIAQPSVVVARVLLEQLGLLDESLLMCYDDELWFRLAARSEIEGIDEVLTLVRRHAQHSGSDVIAWRDRRRVFEKMLRNGAAGDLGHRLHELRARMAAGLAKSEAMSGKRLSALGTILVSARYSWQYPHWWRGALAAMARAFAPAGLRRVIGRYRHRRRNTVSA